MFFLVFFFIGTCFSTSECTSKGGRTSGTCAAGIQVVTRLSRCQNLANLHVNNNDFFLHFVKLVIGRKFKENSKLSILH